jgi:hypothetical protein
LFWIHESELDSESLVVNELKNNYFVKIGGTKENHDANAHGTSHVYFPLKIFSKQKFIENLEFFGIVTGIVTF